MELPSIVEHNAEALTASNPPFLPRIHYRSDDYSTLRHKMLRHLEEAFPEWNATLAEKQGRLDFGVAFVELFAYLVEILSFYQDRRANEAFLRTAVLRGSIIDLCQLIDYHLAPGSSASTLQVFLLKEAEQGTVPSRFPVKTEPRDGRPALIFETARAIEADVVRNELRLFGFNRSTRRLNQPGFSREETVLLDQGYGGLKAASFVVFQAQEKPLMPPKSRP